MFSWIHKFLGRVIRFIPVLWFVLLFLGTFEIVESLENEILIELSEETEIEKGSDSPENEYDCPNKSVEFISLDIKFVLSGTYDFNINDELRGSDIFSPPKKRTDY